MASGRVAALIGVAFLTMVANVFVSILYMVVYGHVIDPGHESTTGASVLRIAKYSDRPRRMVCRSRVQSSN